MEKKAAGRGKHTDLDCFVHLHSDTELLVSEMLSERFILVKKARHGWHFSLSPPLGAEGSPYKN